MQKIVPFIEPKYSQYRSKEFYKECASLDTNENPNDQDDEDFSSLKSRLTRGNHSRDIPPPPDTDTLNLQFKVIFILKVIFI